DREQPGVPHAEVESGGDQDRDHRGGDEEEEEVVDLELVLQKRQHEQTNQPDPGRSVECPLRPLLWSRRSPELVEPAPHLGHPWTAAPGTMPLGRSSSTSPSAA